jgi:hypothetical protein
MSVAFHNACRELLPKAQLAVDRCNVAKRFNDLLYGQRKNHLGEQGEPIAGEMGFTPGLASAASPEPVQEGPVEVGVPVSATHEAAAVVPDEEVSI